MTTFKPTTDLHFHVDAMTPQGIKYVSDLHDLEFAGRTIEEIAAECQVPPGSSGTWDDWYKVHTRARKAVFVRPEVFQDVARAAVLDAEREGLRARVMRFSLSMPQFCFVSKYGRKPDFTNKSDRLKFLELLEDVASNLCIGFSRSAGGVETPMMFSISEQDDFLPILDEVVATILSCTGRQKYIKGIDLTNEQLHRTAQFYLPYVDKLRNAGMSVLTIHVAEKTDRQTEELRILSALSLNPDLLGHATYAIFFPQALDAIQESRVTIEVCPSSHMYAEPFASNPQISPLLVFRERGIPVTINSDTPGTTAGGSLAQEFAIVESRLGLSPEELQEIDAYAWQTFCRLYSA